MMHDGGRGGDFLDEIEPIKGPGTFKNSVYTTLHSLIQNLNIPPGKRLVEQSLSERFEVSKTPVREAMLMLEKDRLIEMVPHTGATVSWLSLTDYEQQLFILDALELPALALVGDAAKEADFADWEKDVAEICGAFTHGDLSRYRRAVASLHRRMFAAAGYPRLTELIAQVQEALYRYGVLLVDSDEGERQRELDVVVQRFECVRSGDIAAAQNLVKSRHAKMLERVRERVRDRDEALVAYIVECR
jgi:DNA-binding GntR family transcriptional regulator